MKHLYTLLVTCLIASHCFAQIPTANLVAHYAFSGNANDSTANANHGTVVGVSLVADRFNNPNSAFSFDGIDDRIVIPHHQVIDFDAMVDSYSFSFWVKSADPQPGSLSFRLMEKRLTGSNEGYPVGISTNTNNLGDHEMHLKVHDGSSYEGHNSGDAYWDGNWHHLVFIVDNTTSQLRVYVDCQLQGETSFSLAGMGQNGGDLVLGNSYTFVRPYQGMMDDLRIYSDVLTPAEVCALTNEGTVGMYEPHESLATLLYPNPVTDVLQLKVPFDTSIESITIMDLTGKIVKNLAVSGMDQTRDFQIDVTDLSTGIYLLEVIGNGQRSVKKFIKK